MSVITHTLKEQSNQGLLFYKRLKPIFFKVGFCPPCQIKQWAFVQWDIVLVGFCSVGFCPFPLHIPDKAWPMSECFTKTHEYHKDFGENLSVSCQFGQTIFPSTTIRQLYFITKMPTFGLYILYEYKEDGSVCGFNRKPGLAETNS